MSEQLSPALTVLSAAVACGIEQTGSSTVLHSAAPQRGAAGSSDDPTCPDGDWQHVIASAQLHGVVGLVHEAFRAGFPAPRSAVQRLSELHNVDLRRAVRLSSELIRLLQLLDRHGVRAVPIKGPLLAQQCYGSLSRRSFWDLDLLLPPQSVTAARDALLEDGYLPEEAWGARRLRRELRRNCEYNLDHRGRGVHVELHWRLVPRHIGFDCSTQALLRRARTTRFLGHELRVPAVEDQLLALLIHHGGKHGWERLRMVADIAVLLRQPDLPPPALLLERATGSGVRRILATSVLLVDRLFALAVDLQLLSAARAEPGAKRLADAAVARMERFDGITPEEGLSGLLTYLRSRERLRDRLRYLPAAAAAVFTPGEHERKLLPLPRALRVVHAVVRPLRLLAKYALKARTGSG